MYLQTILFKKFDSIELKESLFKEFKLPDHFHETYCIGLLSQGIKKSIIEGNRAIMHSNSVSIINPYQVHSDENYDQDASLYRMIYINKDAVRFIARKISGCFDNAIIFTNESISDPMVLKAIMNIFSQIPEENLLNDKLYHLIDLLLKNYKLKLEEKTSRYQPIQNALHDSISFARLNFAGKIDINKMAANYKLSKFQFIRYFKKITGLTPASYMIVCRINHAKSLVLKGLPIGQAALEAGFYDHSQYCKYFKYFTGLSPLEYQKNCSIL